MKKRLLCCLMLIINICICMGQTMQKHTVKRGETLESIAQSYGITVSALKEANPNMGEYFYVGMVLNVPEKKEVVVPSQEMVMPKRDNDSALITNTTPKEAYSQTSRRTPLSTNLNEGFIDSGREYYFIIRPKEKLYGLQFGGLLGKYLYMAINAGMGFQKGNNTGEINFGIGLGSKYKFGPFLFQGCLYPYAGGSYRSDPEYDDYGNQKGDKDKKEFTYGAAANLGIGYNIYKRKKDGGGTYLTVGYIMCAPKFKTDEMVKSGIWLLGLSTDF